MAVQKNPRLKYVAVVLSSGPINRLCGLVVRVPGYRSGRPGFDSQALEEEKSSGFGKRVHPAS
jgi:hypothetical protein